MLKSDMSLLSCVGCIQCSLWNITGLRVRLLFLQFLLHIEHLNRRRV